MKTVDLAAPVVGRLLARCEFPPTGEPVACAVSGGADSLTLLVLAAAAGCEVTSFHVDHGLRAGSESEGAVVAEASARVGARTRSLRVEVAPGPNLEARARAARYDALPPGVLTGHTADDRAETILLHLLRGAGPTGMAGMRRGAQRPLLDLRRRDTETLCAELGLTVVQDPSNRDPAFRRNRVRHELLPLLSDIADRDVVAVLVRQADLFAGLDDVVVELASGIDATSAAELRAAPAGIAGAAVRAWLLGEGVGDGYPADAATVDRVLAVAGNDRVATEVGGGWRVARTRGRLSVTRAGPWQDAPHA